MLFMVLVALSCVLACLFAAALLMAVSSLYSVFTSRRRSRTAEHLRHYHLHLLEDSLQA